MALVSVVALCACHGSDSEERGNARRAAPLVINGSTTLYQVVFESAQQFVSVYPGVRASVAQSSSGNGVARLIAGDIDIATSSRAPLPREYNLAHQLDIPLKTYQIGYDALVIIVHPDKYRYITGITRDQAHAIFFAGSITEWAQLHDQVGGSITPYVRDPITSGTAAEAADYLTGSETTPYARRGVMLDFTPDVTRRVAGDPDGIGFVPLALVDDSVRMLALGDSEAELVQPTLDNVRNLSYPLRRDLYLITRGTPLGARNQFIQFMLSSRGQALLATANLIPLH